MSNHAIDDGDSTPSTTPLLQVPGELRREAILRINAEEVTGNPVEINERSSSRRCSWLDGDTPTSVVVATLLILASGCSLGIWVAPKNMSLPTPWYRTVSAMLGYTYFMCWSVSFYPQVIINFQRKSTQGLSPDFCCLNVLGFACYSAFTLSLYFSKHLQHIYEHRHNGAKITIETNDVAFAVHALLLSSCTLIQIGFYDGFRIQKPSTFVRYFLVGVGIICFLFPILIFTFSWATWLDYLYLLSYIKILISIIKYVPQVALNSRRKSTVGWSIWNILLDFSGGLLSDLQLILDSIDAGDLYSGITGNLAKLGLGLVSIGFDIIFIWQHFIMYPNSSQYIEARQTPEDDDDIPTAEEHGNIL